MSIREGSAVITSADLRRKRTSRLGVVFRTEGNLVVVKHFGGCSEDYRREEIALVDEQLLRLQVEAGAEDDARIGSKWADFLYRRIELSDEQLEELVEEESAEHIREGRKAAHTLHTLAQIRAEISQEKTRWHSINRTTNRLEVPGGWLYRVEGSPAVFVPASVG